MSIQDPIALPGSQKGFMVGYLEALSLVERLHRLLLDVIKDEFERVGALEINAVQALLLFNIGDNEVTAGELKTRGYYQGSNVSYNLKRFVKMHELGWGSMILFPASNRGKGGGERRVHIC
jgi:DNA-binding MarR family transcriptional regulator